MSDLTALVRRWDEAMSAKDAAAAAAMSPEDVEYRDHRALGWETLQGRAAVQAWYQSMMDGVESLHVRSEVVEDRGETVLLRQTGTFRARDSDGGGEGVPDLERARDAARRLVCQDRDLRRGRRARLTGSVPRPS